MSSAIHLDTNYLIQFAGGKKPAETVLEWIGQGISIHVSAMAWAEFRCGPLSEEECTLVSEILSGVIPVTEDVANEAGRLFDATGRRSRSLADCLIAATAIGARAKLATNNRSDFKPFLAHGLELV